MTHPPYPTKEELRATRTPALVALAFMLMAAIALIVMLTLQITGVASFSGSTWIAVFFGGVIAVMLTGLVGASKRRGRARNISDHPAGNVTLSQAERQHYRSLRYDTDTINTKENK